MPKNPRTPYQTRVYFHFSRPVPFSLFSRSFGDLILWAAPALPDSYFVRTDASFSTLRHVFQTAFSTFEEYAGTRVAILKLKETANPYLLPEGSDSLFDTDEQGKWISPDALPPAP